MIHAWNFQFFFFSVSLCQTIIYVALKRSLFFYVAFSVFNIISLYANACSKHAHFSSMISCSFSVVPKSVAIKLSLEICNFSILFFCFALESIRCLFFVCYLFDFSVQYVFKHAYTSRGLAYRPCEIFFPFGLVFFSLSLFHSAHSKGM